MARVEVRTDEGGHPLDLDAGIVALEGAVVDPGLCRSKNSLRVLLTMRSISHTPAATKRRRGRAMACGHTLRIPFREGPSDCRAFLRWTSMSFAPWRRPYGPMAGPGSLGSDGPGGPNTAETMRRALRPLADRAGRVPGRGLGRIGGGTPPPGGARCRGHRLRILPPPIRTLPSSRERLAGA